MNKFSSTTLKIVAGGVFAFALAFASTASAYTFTTTLKQGSKGEAVKELQKFLNNYSSETMVAASGAGSKGMETSTFGPATKKAVQAFQKKNGLAQVGQVGPATRALLNGGSNGGDNGGSNPVTTNGVSKAATSPAAGTLIATQANAKLLDMTFAGNYTVTNVKLMKGGISTNSTLSNIYLFDGATRLTDAATINSMGEISFNAPSGLFMVNGSKTISVMADVASGTSGQTVSVRFASAMAGTTAIAGSAEGSTFTIATNPSNMSTVSFASSTVTPSGATLNTGTGITLWQSSATVSNNDVYLDRVAFRQVGSAPAAAFANFKLYVNGVEVASATGLDSNGYVTFVPSSPVLMVSGTRVMRVDADLVSGASRTVQLSLRTAADAGFRDSQLGVNVTAAGLPEVAASASTIAGATGGSLTIERDTTSASGNTTLGGSDVALAVFKATAYGEPIKIETLTAGGTFDGSLGSTNDAAVTLRNGRLLINGVQYGSTATLVPAGTSFTTNYTVYPGTPVKIEIRADVYDNDGTGALDASDTIVASLIAGSSNAQRVDSLGSLSTSAASGNQLTVASASATLVKNPTYANQTTTLPAANYKIGSWNLSGSSSEDILLTTLSFDVDEVVSTEFDEGDITNMYAVIKNGSTIVAQPSPLATVSATDNNFSINYTLVKNGVLTVELYGNLSDDGSDSAIDAADSFKTDLTVTGTALTSGTSINASSGDIDGQTIAYGAASITASADASNPVTSIVYDNQTVTTLAAKFAAVTSGYTVTAATVTVAEASAVSSVELYDGSTLVASRPGATSVAFSGLNWTVPANTNKVLTVKLVLSTVGIGAGNTGADITTAITAFTATNTSTGVSAAGTVSSANGAATYVYAATPTITNVALPETTLSNGTKTVAKFTVSSNGGTIGWKYFAFTITKVMSGTDTLASATLWDVDTNTQVTGTPTFTGSVDVDNDTAGGLTFVATNEQQVNGTKTYALKMTVAGATTAGDYLSVSIAQPLSAYDAPDAYADVLTDDATATFVWTDQSIVSHDETTNDWNHGYLVKNLPTDTQTLTY